MIYFDHNATSPLLPAARDAWLDASSRFIGNPSSPHRLGARAEAALARAREKLALSLGCRPAEIVWTGGATESNNTILAHLAASRTGEAWISAIEHPSVLQAARRWFPGRLRLIPVTSQGVIDLVWLKRELATAMKTSQPAFVAVMAANNETGVIQPWQDVGALCRAWSLPFFCDASQWLGKMPAAGLGSCEFISACAHKFGGPQGVGFIKSTEPLLPLLLGGRQEDGSRAGTENVAGVLAMIAALEARAGTDLLSAHLAQRAHFEAALIAAMPDCEIVGNASARLWNTVCVIMPEIDCRQRWVVKLDKLGFAVSTGSACASGREKPSYVLAAMGLTSEKAARVLRLSSAPETAPADWLALLDGLLCARKELGA